MLGLFHFEFGLRTLSKIVTQHTSEQVADFRVRSFGLNSPNADP
jgi:hypothetical protein